MIDHVLQLEWVERMCKIIRIAAVCLALILISIGVYWFIIHPNTYKYDTAVKRGDVVMSPSGQANVEKLHTFIQKVQDHQPDKIRVAAYSKEGYPSIHDLNYDGKVIRCTTDNTRNPYGRSILKEYGVYTKVTVNDIHDYSLIDETGKYKKEWIFQE